MLEHGRCWGRASWLTGGIAGNITIAHSGQPRRAWSYLPILFSSATSRSASFSSAAATFSSRWATELVPGIDQHVGRASEEPGQRNLIDGRAMPLRHPVKRTAFAEAAGRERKPGNEGHSFPLANPPRIPISDRSHCSGSGPTPQEQRNGRARCPRPKLRKAPDGAQAPLPGIRASAANCSSAGILGSSGGAATGRSGSSFKRFKLASAGDEGIRAVHSRPSDPDRGARARPWWR